MFNINSLQFIRFGTFLALLESSNIKRCYSMKMPGKDLKRALAALAHQDVSDYFSMNAKIKVLGYED